MRLERSALDWHNSDGNRDGIPDEGQVAADLTGDGAVGAAVLAGRDRVFADLLGAQRGRVRRPAQCWSD
jgi:hypothetical protein